LLQASWWPSGIERSELQRTQTHALKRETLARPLPTLGIATEARSLVGAQ
jgi:hypothetical protein